jgi:hypothetical protein
MIEDPHSPTTAGPQPTPVVTPAGATREHPAGTAAADPSTSGPLANLPVDVDEHPEILVGAAFVGGVLAAMILKRLGR